MANQFAGRFYDALFDSSSKLLKQTQYIVTTDVAGTIQATLYTDRTKATSASAVRFTDDKGMAEFFAVPGDYYINVGGMIQKRTVLEDLADTADVQFVTDSIATHNADGTAVHGIADTSKLVSLDDDDLIPLELLPPGIGTGTEGLEIGSNDWLIAIAASQAFKAITDVVRDANGALLTATVTWPDDVAGTFVVDTVSTAFLGFVDAWHFTYAGTTTKTITQVLVTRGTNGDIIVQPPLIVS